MVKIPVDRVQPQATEIEASILGALMQVKDALAMVSEILKPEVFYDERHATIFQAIQKLYRNGKPVDLLTVTAELRAQNTLEQVGGAYYVTQLTSGVTSATNIEYHALLVQQEFLRRSMIRICSDYATKSFDASHDIFDLYENVSSELFKMVSVNVGQEASRISDILSERIKEYELPPVDGLVGLGSGFNDIDRITSGWQNSDLIILAARPSMGKTALALNFARHAAIKYKKSVAIFSLEMSKAQLVDRMVSAETGIYLENLRTRRLSTNDKQMIYKANDLINSNIFIDDTVSLNINQFRSKATRLKQKQNIGLIVVDYLQLMHGDKAKGGIREQEISSISRMLKTVAKELDVPVIALAQLSRAAEHRPGSAKRPMLSDLRESGSIEQDADQVLFLFRPEYYGIYEDEQGRSTQGVSEVLFAKNRHGPLDTAVLKFSGAKMQFNDLEAFEAPKLEIYHQGTLPLQSPPFKETVLGPSENFNDDDDEHPF